MRGFATLVGGDRPTGTVTFELFSDLACTVRVFTSTSPVTASAIGTPGAESAPYVITTGGVYHWVSTYSGDARNNPAGPTPCGHPLTTVTIPKSITEISTQAVPAAATVGSELRSVATLFLGTLPSGTVTFQLYNDEACASQVFVSTVPLDPVSRTATSDPYVVNAPGVYHWVAVYTGDIANLPSPRPACRTLGSTVRVMGATTTTSTSTSTSVPATTTTSTSTSVPATTSTTTVPATTSTSTTTVPTTPATPTASAMPKSVTPGRDVTVAGTGFPAGAPLRVDLLAVPFPLATTVAEASGSYQVVVIIPGETPLGQHTIVVSGPGGTPRSETSVTVVPPPLSILRVLVSLLGLLA